MNNTDITHPKSDTIKRVVAGVLASIFTIVALLKIINPSVLEGFSIELCFVVAFICWVVAFRVDLKTANYRFALKSGVVVGFISLVVGFFSPMLLAPEANQGPLLGIVIAPLGFALGAVGGYLYARFRTRESI